MKKFLKLGILGVIISSMVVVSGCFFDLFSCSSDEPKEYVNISTIDELYAMESTGYYQLTCDLDLQEREWYSLEVMGFNGGGFTIKNCQVSISTSSGYAGFFSRAESIANVTFDNIQVTSTTSASAHAGIIAGYVNNWVENVRVKNSKGVFTHYVSGGSSYLIVGGIAGKCGKVSNSSVEDSSITCNSTVYGKITAGGLSGKESSGVDFTNNKVNNVEMTVKCRQDANVGGMIGGYGGAMTNCIVSNCTINVESASSTVSRAGGIMAEGNDRVSLDNCASVNNSIKLISEEAYNIGGFAGKCEGEISNCLSDSNILVGETSSTLKGTFAGVGGFCGSNYATISKSISQNNRLTGTNTTTSADMFVGGFIASVGASITKCAVYNNTLSGGKTDVFTKSVSNYLYDCQIVSVGTTAPNVNGLPVLDDAGWLDIMSTLSLSSELWSMENGNLNLIIAK